MRVIEAKCIDSYVGLILQLPIEGFPKLWMGRQYASFAQSNLGEPCCRKKVKKRLAIDYQNGYRI